MQGKNNSGQIAVWVIIALAIVALTLLIFTFKKNPIAITSADENNPKSYIDNCVKTEIENTVDLMLPRGGFVNPKNSIMYYNVPITYLCKNTGNYLPCINQHPDLIEELRKEIVANTKEKVIDCFAGLKDSLESRNMKVNMEEGINYDVNLAPNRINVILEKNVTIEDNDGTSKINDFGSEIVNPIYNLANVALEIANQEAKYCYFEYVGYMALYPKYNIDKDALSDSTKIYTIEYLPAKKKMSIAVRGCAIPPGI